jgi:hypothetical protein
MRIQGVCKPLLLLEDLVPLLALELIHPDVEQLLLLDNALLGILRVETQRSFVVKRNLRRVVDPLHLALVLGYVDPSSLERTIKSASGFGTCRVDARAGQGSQADSSRLVLTVLPHPGQAHCLYTYGMIL